MAPTTFRSLALAATLGATLAAPGHAPAAPLSTDEARRIVAPFYEALNAEPGRDIRVLVERSMAADWVSCSGDAACVPRERVIGNVEGFTRAIPDLRWTIREVLVSGERIVVRGEASGTPTGEFMGVPHGGKRFTTMSIDIHTVENGQVRRTYHVEDWAGALRQLRAP